MENNIDKLLEKRVDAEPYIPDCWACLDNGIVTFGENENERGARCICERGKRFANAGIASIDKFLNVDELISKNMAEFKEVYKDNKEVLKKMDRKLKNNKEESL